MGIKLVAQNYAQNTLRFADEKPESYRYALTILVRQYGENTFQIFF